ncbi:MAG: hypothetical protein RH947_09355 [Alcanivorax sp.]
MTEEVPQSDISRYDTLTLAAEQMDYLEAICASIADALSADGRRGEKICRARQLALLGRSHAEQWSAAFSCEMEGVKKHLESSQNY